MARVTPLQTTFAAGEIDPRLLARTDLTAYGEGAARLRNVWVTTGGGVKRRAGMRHVAKVAGPGRLVGVPLEDGAARLFVLADMSVQVFDNGHAVATVSAPWTTAELPSLSWAVHRGGLLVCHPRLPPHRVFLDAAGGWRVIPWSYETSAGSGGGRLVHLQPYAKYAPPEATLEAIQNSAGVWTFRANQPVFTPAHAGTRLRFRQAEVLITKVATDGISVVGVPQVTISDRSRTTQWEEQAFSPAAGYPSACLVFRERLVAGGVPAMANGIWMSKIGRLFNFDTGSGLDDEAISFSLGDDPAHAIRAFSAGRELEVFTAKSEWTIDGNPLAPSSTFAVKQTGIGSLIDRQVAPVDVDGASVFVGSCGERLIEYVFTDIDTAYQAQDLAVRARHLMVQPRDLTFDRRRRLLIVVSGSGALATAMLDRNAQTVAWSCQTTAGHIVAATTAGDDVYLLVERDGTYRLECFDDSLFVDAAITRSAAAPATDWVGLDHLEGQLAAVIGDGHDLGTTGVADGRASLSAAAKTIQLGLPYRHEVEPLPLVVNGRHAELYRPLEVGFELYSTPALALDLGEGVQNHALAGPSEAGFTGRRRFRARGWRRGNTGPLWRIEGDRPLPFHLLSATADVKVTR